ncbi:MAG TPA: RpiB/LacA/LacB family sugar-phosphate isomerase [Candidatus Omnitrophota bacterium]|nr:RpiB/LacA/LacB family sugar-phosphate isomerase [Candidatus Omnitrophota bacterium]
MEIKKVSLASDHRGIEIKSEIAAYLKQRGIEVLDFGTNSSESCDYPDFMFPAAEALGKGECQRAVGICYTGIGSVIAANKVRGVRAALVEDVARAKLTRQHNDSNMLILASGFHSNTELMDIVKAWFDTEFEGGRHEQRVGKIKSYESKNARV